MEKKRERGIRGWGRRINEREDGAEVAQASGSNWSKWKRASYALTEY